MNEETRRAFLDEINAFDLAKTEERIAALDQEVE